MIAFLSICTSCEKQDTKQEKTIDTEKKIEENTDGENKEYIEIPIELFDIYENKELSFSISFPETFGKFAINRNSSYETVISDRILVQGNAEETIEEFSELFTIVIVDEKDTSKNYKTEDLILEKEGKKVYVLVKNIVPGSIEDKYYTLIKDAGYTKKTSNKTGNTVIVADIVKYMKENIK